MFDNLKLDIKQARKHNAGPGESTWKVLMRPTTFAVVNYRFGRWVHNMPSPLRTGLGVVSTVVRYVTEIMTGVHISPLANAGPRKAGNKSYRVFVRPAITVTN